jgi:hypothetical protein
VCEAVYTGTPSPIQLVFCAVIQLYFIGDIITNVDFVEHLGVPCYMCCGLCVGHGVSKWDHISFQLICLC